MSDKNLRKAAISLAQGDNVEIWGLTLKAEPAEILSFACNQCEVRSKCDRNMNLLCALVDTHRGCSNKLVVVK